MSILVDLNSRVITQRMTGAADGFHAGQVLACGTKMIGGVGLGKDDPRLARLNGSLVIDSNHG